MSLVFVSYSHVDTDVADALTATLSEHDVQYFRDVKNIEWGTSINSEVREALDDAVAILVIISPASLKSQWVPYELGYASALKKRILPFLTHPSLDVPDFIREFSYYTDLEQVKQYFSSSFPPETPASPERSRSELDVGDKLLRIMPALLNEMREDLAGDETELIRECVVLPSRGVMFNGGGKRRFAYFGNEHDDLRNKMELLEQHGLLMDVTPGNTPIYRMTDEFVEWLMSVQVAS